MQAGASSSGLVFSVFAIAIGIGFLVVWGALVWFAASKGSWSWLAALFIVPAVSCLWCGGVAFLGLRASAPMRVSTGGTAGSGDVSLAISQAASAAGLPNPDAWTFDPFEDGTTGETVTAETNGAPEKLALWVAALESSAYADVVVVSFEQKPVATNGAAGGLARLVVTVRRASADVAVAATPKPVPAEALPPTPVEPMPAPADGAPFHVEGEIDGAPIAFASASLDGEDGVNILIISTLPAGSTLEMDKLAPGERRLMIWVRKEWADGTTVEVKRCLAAEAATLIDKNVGDGSDSVPQFAGAWLLRHDGAERLEIDDCVDFIGPFSAEGGRLTVEMQAFKKNLSTAFDLRFPGGTLHGRASVVSKRR